MISPIITTEYIGRQFYFICGDSETCHYAQSATEIMVICCICCGNARNCLVTGTISRVFQFPLPHDPVISLLGAFGDTLIFATQSYRSIASIVHSTQNDREALDNSTGTNGEAMG